MRDKLGIIGILIGTAAILGLFALTAQGSQQTGSVLAQPANLGGDMRDSLQFGGYLPNWLSDDEYSRINKLTGIDQLFIAFAVPMADSSIPEVYISPAGAAAATKLAQQADGGTYISIGGWGGSAQSRASILTGFNNGLDSPEPFAATISSTVRALERRTGIKDIGVDLDFEFPTEEQSRKLVRLVHYLHEAGIQHVSVAVAAGGESSTGMRTVARELAGLGVDFNIMTYDMHGPWSQQAGPLSTRAWTVDSIDGWVEETGDASRIHVGFPTYCRTFVGARQSGDTFNAEATMRREATSPQYLRDIPAMLLAEDDAMGSTTVQSQYGWTSCISARQAAGTMEAIRKRHPDIGGAFVWDLKGTTGDYITTVRSR
jgi:GH18 family chitinase